MLRSFVWPFHVSRHSLLTGALAVARHDPAVVDRSGAARWLEAQLDQPVDDDVLTVVWHSITRMYWSADEAARASAAIAEAACRQRVARVAMEYPETVGGVGPELTLAVGGEPSIVLADVGDHGVPVSLRPAGRARLT